MTRPGHNGTARDHVGCDHSGGSTLRRSLGALLKDQLQPRLSPKRRAPGDSPQNWRCYRFQDEGETALTRWMKDKLRTNFLPLDGAREVRGPEFGSPVSQYAEHGRGRSDPVLRHALLLSQTETLLCGAQSVPRPVGLTCDAYWR